jgi:hypothetical protein
VGKVGIDVIVPVARRRTIDELLYSFSCNTARPDLITLVSNELSAGDIQTHGLDVRLLRFDSSVYAIGSMDVALRRNVGIWASESSHVVTFDDDQLAPVDLVENCRARFAAGRYFWGHYRYIDFSQWSVDELLRLPAIAGKPRESPPNSWHTFRSAYAGLFGAERSLLLDIGGFDMLFSGRHGGEDQDLGRRLAERTRDGGRVFVCEPPFAWHPMERVPWDADRRTNLCPGDHDLAVGAADGVQRCLKCPFLWAPDAQLFRNDVSMRFDPRAVTTAIEVIPATRSPKRGRI